MGDLQTRKSRSSYQKGTYRQVGYRYINLFVYILAAFGNSLPAQSFSSINSLVQQKFNFSPVIITLNTLVFPIFHPIFAFPANYILDKFGMKWGCAFGGVLVIIGVWLRTLMKVNEPLWCLFGSCLTAIGNIFVLNSSSILANNWFKIESIPKIISISVLANLVSVTLGASLPGLILEKDSTADQIIDFLFIQAIVITIPLVLMILLMKDHPPVPPSRSAQTRKDTQQKYSQNLKKLFKNKEYLKIMLSMTFEYGIMISYLAILDQSLSSLGYEDPGQITAVTILSATVVGIFSTFIFSSTIKRTLMYKNIIGLCISLGFVTFVALQVIYTRVQEHQWAIIIIGSCMGFFFIPLPALYMAYSSETVFPLGEGSATGYIFAASQTFGFLLGLGSISFIDKDNEWKTYITMGLHCFFLLLSLAAIMTTKQILNRTNHELTKTLKGEEQNFIKYDNSK